MHQYVEQTAASVPTSPAGKDGFFFDSADGQPKWKNSSGTVVSLAPDNGAYALLHESFATIGSGVTSGTFLMGTNGVKTTVDITTTLYPVFIFKSADRGLTGMTQKMRLRFALQTNATAPGTITFTGGVYPVTVAGGSSAFNPTLGTVVSGSTVALANPSASSVASEGNSGDFTIPSDQILVGGYTTSATSATNGLIKVMCQIQGHSV